MGRPSLYASGFDRASAVLDSLPDHAYFNYLAGWAAFLDRQPAKAIPFLDKAIVLGEGQNFYEAVVGMRKHAADQVDGQ